MVNIQIIVGEFHGNNPSYTIDFFAWNHNKLLDYELIPLLMDDEKIKQLVCDMFGIQKKSIAEILNWTTNRRMIIDPCEYHQLLQYCESP